MYMHAKRSGQVKSETNFSLSLSLTLSLQRVVELSKRYLTQLSCGLSDPRVKVHIQDGAEFVAQHRDKFDVIITDSPDDKGEDHNMFLR